MAELQLKENPMISLTFSDTKRPVQQVQCSDRWTRRCLNKECLAFRNVNGDYYCIRKNLP